MLLFSSHVLFRSFQTFSFSLFPHIFLYRLFIIFHHARCYLYYKWNLCWLFIINNYMSNYWMCHLSQAMKVENMLKIKEEFDYKSLSRRLELQLDKLIAENERQQKAFEDDVDRINVEAQNRTAEVERSFTDALEVC